MPISEVVRVSISVQDRFPSRAGFGVPLILDPNNYWGPELVRSFSSVQEIIDSGVPQGSALVKAATSVFGNNPSPQTVKVGRRHTDNQPDFSFSLTLLPTSGGNLTIGDVYTISVFGTTEATASVTVTSGVLTPTQVAQAFVTALTANPVTGLALAEATGTLTFNAAAPGVTYGVRYSVVDNRGVKKNTSSHFTASDATPAANIVTAYDAVRAEDDAFYFVLSTSQSPAELAALSARINSDGATAPKFFVCTSGNSDVITGDQLIGATNQVADSDRVLFLYHDNSFSYPDAAWVSVMAPIDPGSATWKFKTLPGIESYSLTTTQKNIIKNVTSPSTRRGNVYTRIGGLDVTGDGVCTRSTGETPRFADITRGIDWLIARMEERLFGVLAQAQKIPYVDTGVAIVEAQVRAQLLEGISQGVLAETPTPVVTVPVVANLTPAQRASRVLPGVTFSAQLAGAIHEITISGTVTP